MVLKLYQNFPQSHFLGPMSSILSHIQVHTYMVEIKNFKSLVKQSLKSTVAKQNHKPIDLRNIKNY